MAFDYLFYSCCRYLKVISISSIQYIIYTYFAMHFKIIFIFRLSALLVTDVGLDLDVSNGGLSRFSSFSEPSKFEGSRFQGFQGLKI